MQKRLQRLQQREARHDSSSPRAASCPSWDRTRTLLIQSAGPRATKTDKMTGSGVPTSIGALSVWHLCPLRSGETLAKRLQRVLLGSPGERPGGRTGTQAFDERDGKHCDKVFRNVG